MTEAQTFQQYKWQRSIWLSRAQEVFMNKSEMEKLESLTKTHPVEAIASAVSEFAQMWKAERFEESSIEKSGIKPWKEIQEEGMTTSELYSHSKKRIRTWLQEGKLIILGFDRPRILDTEPVEIDSVRWSVEWRFDADIKWNQNLVEFEGLRFTEARLFAPEWESKLNVDWFKKIGVKSIPSEPTRAGTAQNIEVAFRELLKSAQIDGETSMVVLTDMTRNLMVHLFPNEGYRADASSPRPSKEAMRSTLSALRDEQGWPKLRAGRRQKR